MLYTEETVKANIRSRDGGRVFYLGKNDTLTPGARDYLTRERIGILPAEKAKPEGYRLENGAILREKPEHMTHLQGNILVSKAHPRIGFRGAMDTLQAEILLCELALDGKMKKQLQEILELARKIIRCDVLEEPLEAEKLCGLTQEELRRHSHRPQDYYGQPHFMPDIADGEEVLRLNRLRCAVREAERMAVIAYCGPDGRAARVDILQALNRMSSMVYILMIKLKKER